MNASDFADWLAAESSGLKWDTCKRQNLQKFDKVLGMSAKNSHIMSTQKWPPTHSHTMRTYEHDKIVCTKEIEPR